MSRRSLGILFSALALCLAAFSAWTWWISWTAPLVSAVVRADFSVEGVAVGAPVRVNGVAVGQVESIGLCADGEGRLRPELRLEVDPDLLAQNGLTGRLKSNLVHEEVARGLVARLAAVSPASGLLQVELVWQQDRPASAGFARDEIPAVGGTMQQKYERLAEGFEDLARRDLIALAQEFEADLDRWDSLADPRLASELNLAWVARTDGLDAAAKALAEGPGLKDAARACRRLREAVESADASVSPERIALLQARLADASAALGSIAASLDASRGVMEGASSDLSAAFRALSEAAKSWRAKARGLTTEPLPPAR